MITLQVLRFLLDRRGRPPPGLLLRSAALVYQRLNSDPTKRGPGLHKVFSQLSLAFFFASLYLFIYLFTLNKWSFVSRWCTMLTSAGDKGGGRIAVVRAPTWVRANMVLYWLPVTGTFSPRLRDLCVFTEKHAQDGYWCQNIMHSSSIIMHQREQERRTWRRSALFARRTCLLKNEWIHKIHLFFKCKKNNVSELKNLNTVSWF